MDPFCISIYLYADILLEGKVDQLDQIIAATDAEIAHRVDPQQATIDLLDTITGIDHRTAETVLAEIGTDMSRFPDADHLAAWAGLAPGQNESGGKAPPARGTGLCDPP